jgi:hypothetical protein
MLVLAGANTVGVVLFAALYAVAGTGLMGQSAFLLCLVILFGLVTALWVRTEARHRHLDPLARLGRAAVGVVLVVVGTPIAVLMPLFWLDTLVPPEAGLHRVLAPVMTLVLISLALIVLANFIGAAIVAARALAGRRRPRVPGAPVG